MNKIKDGLGGDLGLIFQLHIVCINYRSEDLIRYRVGLPDQGFLYIFLTHFLGKKEANI